MTEVLSMLTYSTSRNVSPDTSDRSLYFNVTRTRIRIKAGTCQTCQEKTAVVATCHSMDADNAVKPRISRNDISSQEQTFLSDTVRTQCGPALRTCPIISDLHELAPLRNYQKSR